MIPSKAELRVDCRVPPGLGEQETRTAIDEVLGGLDGLRIDFTEQISGNRSPISSPLMDALAAWIERRTIRAPRPSLRSCPASPTHATFRAAFPECVAYGFFPQRNQSLLQTQALIHAPDERIDMLDLAWAADFYRELALELLG